MRFPNPERVTEALAETAALDVLPRFRGLQAGEIMEKAPGDVVTVADIDAEHRLTRILAGMLPGSRVVGEEAFSKRPEILDHFETEDAIWVIDPVDGTDNFSKGKARFCMMVGLIVRGQTGAAWIHDLVTGDTAVAERGAGAFHRGARMAVPAPPSTLDRLVGSVNFGFWPPERRAGLKERCRRFAEVSSLRCAGHEFLGMATGVRHFSLYRRLWPWDHVPGVLILEEAGGWAERLDGADYRPADRVAGLLSAPNRETWTALQAFFRAA